MGVFLYDLIRATRRGRLALLRAVYALIMLAALCGVYVRWFPGRFTVAGLFEPGPARVPALPRVAVRAGAGAGAPRFAPFRPPLRRQLSAGAVRGDAAAGAVGRR